MRSKSGKRVQVLFLMLALLLSLPTYAAAAGERSVEFKEGVPSYRLTEKGKSFEKKMKAASFLQNGKLMIPIRSAVEALGLVMEEEKMGGKTIVRTKNHLIYSEEEGKGKKLTTDNLVWIFYFHHHLMHVSHILGEYNTYMEFDTPPLVRNGVTFMAADEIAKLFNRSLRLDEKGKKAVFGKELPLDISSYMEEIDKNLSHRAPHGDMSEEERYGVKIPEELYEKIEIFTRMANYDAVKIRYEQAVFLLAKKMERVESSVFRGAKDPYGIDFSEGMVYSISEKKIDKLIEDIFCGFPSKDKIKNLLGQHLQEGIYTFDGVGYAEDSEEVPYAGGRHIPDPEIDRIRKLKKDIYLAEITFFPKYSGPMQEFTEEDLQAFAEEGIRVTDDHLFHYPKEYGYLIYKALPEGRYQILYFERSRQIKKEVFRRFSN
ncbi:MAG: hypothetical protein Q4A78_06990 [Peptostreptococcaceae bacterium]|nr:hypothetical protein [Peptostreptococcaceae bacterium]